MNLRVGLSIAKGAEFHVPTQKGWLDFMRMKQRWI